MNAADLDPSADFQSVAENDFCEAVIFEIGGIKAWKWYLFFSDENALNVKFQRQRRDKLTDSRITVPLKMLDQMEAPEVHATDAQLLAMTFGLEGCVCNTTEGQILANKILDDELRAGLVPWLPEGAISTVVERLRSGFGTPTPSVGREGSGVDGSSIEASTSTMETVDRRCSGGVRQEGARSLRAGGSENKLGQEWRAGAEPAFGGNTSTGKCR
jgi:hypothetical protein